MTSHPPTIESLAAPTIPSGAEPAPRVASSRPVRDTFKELTADYDVAESELHAVPSDGARDVPAPSADVQHRRSVPQPIQPRVQRVNVTQRLKDPIPQISLPPLSLAKFVGWVRNFSTIPITVDPVALQQTGSSMTTSISFEGSELTVGQLLSDVLLPLRLGYFVDDDQLVIVAARTINHSLRRRYYEVDDLLGQDSDNLVRLVSFVEAMAAPSSWQRHGGVGKLSGKQQRLVVSQTVSAHYEVLILVDKLRAARGLRIRSNYPTEFFTATTRRAQRSSSPANASRRPIPACHATASDRPRSGRSGRIADARGLASSGRRRLVGRGGNVVGIAARAARRRLAVSA